MQFRNKINYVQNYMVHPTTEMVERSCHCVKKKSMYSLLIFKNNTVQYNYVNKLKKSLLHTRNTSKLSTVSLEVDQLLQTDKLLGRPVVRSLLVQ